VCLCAKPARLRIISASRPLSQVSISPDTRIFKFRLPNDAPLGLSTCACLLASGGRDKDGAATVRPYTPVSTNAMRGAFELMVKVYEKGALSQHMNQMLPGDSLDFKHVAHNVKIQYPFHGAKRIGMLVGGTGVAPMLQALHAILGGAETAGASASLLYASRTQRDILAKETLDAWSASFPDRLDVTHVLSREPERSAWAGERGRIDRRRILASLPPPGDGTLIFVCGPPAMYDTMTGPRHDKELTGLLAEMGYTAAEVVKF
jgi:cytochrome-b5 reductase